MSRFPVCGICGGEQMMPVDECDRCEIKRLESERDRLKKHEDLLAGQVQSKNIEIGRLKAELSVINKGAKTNAEVNKLAVTEISKLRAELEQTKAVWDNAAAERTRWKEKAEALELEKKTSAHISLRLMTAKAERAERQAVKLAEALRTIQAAGEKHGGEIKIAGDIAKAALDEYSKL